MTNRRRCYIWWLEHPPVPETSSSPTSTFIGGRTPLSQAISWNRAGGWWMPHAKRQKNHSNNCWWSQVKFRRCFWGDTFTNMLKPQGESRHQQGQNTGPQFKSGTGQFPTHVSCGQSRRRCLLSLGMRLIPSTSKQLIHCTTAFWQGRLHYDHLFPPIFL